MYCVIKTEYGSMARVIPRIKQNSRKSQTIKACGENKKELRDDPCQSLQTFLNWK